MQTFQRVGLVTWCICSILALSRPASASESAAASLVITAEFSNRTSLKVSTNLLRFDVTDPGMQAMAIVDYAAGVRTRAGGDVMMILETAGPAAGPGAHQPALTLQSTGNGAPPRDVVGGQPTIAAQWIGSGFRRGQLIFTLRAPSPGTYLVPVQFVVAAP